MALAEVQRREVEWRTESERPAIVSDIYLPHQRLDNYMVERWKLLDVRGNPLTAESISRRTGIESRRVAGKQETILNMGVQAARDLVVPGEDIDSVIFTNSFPVPGLNHADELSERLQINPNQTLEIGAACTGFAHAIGLIHENPELYGTDILIVASEKYSPHLADLRKVPPETDPSLAQFLFSDGAVATRFNMENIEILSRASYYEESDDIKMPIDQTPRDSNYERLPVPVSHEYFYQNGANVLKTVARVIPGLVDQVVGEANLDPSEIDIVIPHQPSERVLKSLSERSPYVYLADYREGNFSSASIPMGLTKNMWGSASEAFLNGEKVRSWHRLGQGSTSVWVGFGAGFQAEAIVARFH